MSDSSRLTLNALEKPVNHTMRAIQLGVFAVSVAAAIPTAQNLYYSWKHDVPFTEVSHRLEQYNLWMKNLDCKVDYRALSTAGGTRVDVGSCAKTGDIAIKVSSRSGGTTYEWIAYDQLQKPGASQTASAWSLFATAAIAANGVERGAPLQSRSDGAFQVAQAGMEVLCEAKAGDKIIRVVRDGGKCYRETVSPFKGSVDSRTEVACDAQCQ